MTTKPTISPPGGRHETNYDYVNDLRLNANELFARKQYAKAARLFDRLAGILSDKANFAGSFHRWTPLHQTLGRRS